MRENVYVPPHGSSSHRRRYGYERELLTLLEQLVRDMDRKIERAKERAEKEKGARPLMPDDKLRLEGLKKRQKGRCWVHIEHTVRIVTNERQRQWSRQR